jgi:hypothetical protein
MEVIRPTDGCKDVKYFVSTHPVINFNLYLEFIFLRLPVILDHLLNNYVIFEVISIIFRLSHTS